MNNSFKLLKTEYIADLGAEGSIFEHVKSGARLCHIGCNDDNKVFYIGFRTPPKDSTGVAHIVEHTVLCGSEKYPLKDPFVELCKGSLNTFLNAMTYPDKTVYPVASTNNVDFKNLVDIYMDAVFNPNLYRDERIFKQEGWHYELDSADDELKINGVVYNEMKGAFSSPDDVLYREIMNSLFPDNTYHYESGGDPKVIPELTYEDYRAFHSLYYHPSNSYIYMYGDMDIIEMMDYLDKEYLSKYDRIEVDSEIPMQAPFLEPVTIRKNYPVAMDASEENSTYLSWNVCMGDSLNPLESVAFEIIDGVLFSRPGAPVKEALQKANIAEDISSSFENGIRQFTFSVIGKNANENDRDKFLSIIMEEMSKAAVEGLDAEAIEACLNAMDFKIREADFGHYPKGLMYGLKLLDSWLYDKDQPFLMLNSMNIIKQLRDLAKEGYFEKLLNDRLINNSHVTVLTLVPEAGLTVAQDEMLKSRLAEYKAGLSAEEIDKIVADTADLKLYQETPNTQEELECIPLLSREDLTKNAKPFDNELFDEEGCRVLAHRINTNGINYLRIVFDITGLPFEDLKYVSLIDRLFGLVDTQAHTYEENAKLVYLNTGSFASDFSQIRRHADDSLILTFEVSVRFFTEKFATVYDLVKDITLHSKYDDKERLHTLLSMLKAKMESSFMSSGHVIATMQTAAKHSAKAVIDDQAKGLSFYRFICDLDEHFDEKIDELIAKLNEITMMLFTSSNLLIDVTGQDEEIGQAAMVASDLRTLLPDVKCFEGQTQCELFTENKGIKNAAQVQYVSRGGFFPKEMYNGSFKVAKKILGYGYLWENVRVLGGAYGCMSTVQRNGVVDFVSYRDPKLAETNAIFDKLPDYLEIFDASDRDMTKFVIGTIGGMDTPLTPSGRGDRSYYAYMSGVTYEMIQKERDEVIGCTAEDIRKTAEAFRIALNQNNLCVVGNEGKIEENKELFDKVENML